MTNREETVGAPDQETIESAMIQRGVSGLVTQDGSPDGKRSFLRVVSTAVDIAVKTYLPPGFDAATLGTMLTVAAGTIWTAARALRDFQ